MGFFDFLIRDPLKDSKFAPDIRPEDILASSEGWLDTVYTPNTFIFVTNKKLYVRPLKGKKFAEDKKDRAHITVPLEDITAARLEDVKLVKTIEIETNEEYLYTLTPNNNHAEIIDAIVSGANLEKSDWGKEPESIGLIKSTLGSFGVFGGIIGVLIGILLMGAGILILLTIFGLIVGIPLLLAGLWNAVGSFALIKGGSEVLKSRKEWKKTDIQTINQSGS